MNSFKYTPKPKSRDEVLYLDALRKAFVRKYEKMFIDCGFTTIEAQIAADWYALGPWVTDEEVKLASEGAIE